MKMKQGGAAGTATPRDGTGAMRPGGSVSASRQGSFIGAGSGSDTDARSKSSGNPRIKLTLSQRGSRAASPAVSPGNRSPAGPTGTAASPSASTPQPANQNVKTFPTAEEIAAAVPAEGITINGLLGVFRNRIKGQSADFIKEVKKVTRMDKERNVLVLKGGRPAGSPAA